jgi:catechol 2,3-dioxygenase-like lactoylglutathione lyase family enzyme
MIGRHAHLVPHVPVSKNPLLWGILSGSLLSHALVNSILRRTERAVQKRERDMEINGIAHVFVTAGDFARSRAFYSQLLPFLGLKNVGEGPGIYYCVGGRTGFGVEAPAPEHRDERFDQGRVGLHHVCFRVRERAEVDEAHEFLLGIGAKIVHGPQDDGYAPGYYSVLFEDPDGIRLEINHVPGRGVFDAGGRVKMGDMQ